MFTRNYDRKNTVCGIKHGKTISARRMESIQEKLPMVKKVIVISEDGAAPQTTAKFDGVYEDMLA